MRNCPRCEEQTLSPYSFEKLGVSRLDGGYGTVEGVIVELCECCSGLFFHSSGLEILSGDVGSLFLKDATFVEEKCSSCKKVCSPDEKDCSSCGSVLGLPCSSCEGRMRLAIFMGVEIDICRSCHAIWFDDGELTKVIRRYQRRKKRFSRKKASSKSVPKKISPSEEQDDSLVCVRCHQNGLRPRDIYKTSEGLVCRKCMDKPEGEGRGLSGGMMNDGSMASNVVDAMVTLTVMDAIFDLFSE